MGKKTRVRPRDGHAEHVCKISGSIFQKQRRRLDFLCVNMSKIRGTLFPSNDLVM